MTSAHVRAGSRSPFYDLPMTEPDERGLFRTLIPYGAEEARIAYRVAVTMLLVLLALLPVIGAAVAFNAWELRTFLGG